MTPARPPAAGEPAPEFTLRDQHGAPWTLAERRRHAGAALVFFPYAFSPVCTTELRALREVAPDLAQRGFALAAISCDSMHALRAYADHDGVAFPLLTDFWPHGEVSQRYAVLDRERGHATRSTFVLDREGTVRWTVHNAPGEARPVTDLLAAVEQLPGWTGKVKNR
jgi:peroxiredoxin